MTIQADPPPIAEQGPQPAHTWTDPTGRTWHLDHDFLDHTCRGWAWTGVIDPATGPVLHAVDEPSRRESLVGLALCAGLWQVPLTAAGDAAAILDPLDPLRTAQ